MNIKPLAWGILCGSMFAAMATGGTPEKTMVLCSIALAAILQPKEKE